MSKTGLVGHDRKPPNNGVSYQFDTYEDATPIPEEWYSSEKWVPARPDTDLETRYITPGIFRRFALWLLRRNQESSD